MPPFTVQYYCPSRGQWFSGQRSYDDFNEALQWAQILKRGTSPAQVVDATGQVFPV